MTRERRFPAAVMACYHQVFALLDLEADVAQRRRRRRVGARIWPALLVRECARSEAGVHEYGCVEPRPGAL